MKTKITILILGMILISGFVIADITLNKEIQIDRTLKTYATQNNLLNELAYEEIIVGDKVQVCVYTYYSSWHRLIGCKTVYDKDKDIAKKEIIEAHINKIKNYRTTNVQKTIGEITLP